MPPLLLRSQANWCNGRRLRSESEKVLFGALKSFFRVQNLNKASTSLDSAGQPSRRKEDSRISTTHQASSARNFLVVIFFLIFTKKKMEEEEEFTHRY